MLIKKPQYDFALNMLKNIDSAALRTLTKDFNDARTKISIALNDHIKFEEFLKFDLPEIQMMFRKVNLEIACLFHFVDYDFLNEGWLSGIDGFKEDMKKMLASSVAMERHLVNALAYKYKALGLSKSNEPHIQSLKEYLRLGVGYSVAERNNEKNVPCIFKTSLKNAMISVSTDTDEIKKLLKDNEDLSSFIKLALMNGRFIKVAEVVENLEFSFAMQNVIENKNSIFTDFIDVIQNTLKVPAQTVLMVQLDEAKIDDPAKFSLGYSIVDFTPADALEKRFEKCYSGELQFMHGVSQHCLNFYYPDLDKSVLELSEEESNSTIFNESCNSTVMHNLQSFIQYMFDEFDYVYFINGNVLIKKNEDLQSDILKAEKILNDARQNGDFLSIDNSSKPA